MRTITTTLVLAVGALVALSLTILSSATLLDSSPDASILSQAIACGIGLVAMVGVAVIDYRRMKGAVWLIYGVSLALLILVFVFGREAKGARRWLWGIQPAEFAKLGLIFVLAWYGARNESRMREFWRGVAGSFALAAPLVGLVLLEPDRGTAALLLGMTVLMLIIAGVRWIYIWMPAVLGGAAVAAMIVVSPMARNRIDAWLHPEAHKDGASLQVIRGLHAFAEGGIEGRGLGRGTLKFIVPEVHTDFILPAVGEELGLTFTLAIIAAYLVILACGLAIALRAPDRFGLLLASGVIFLICAQATVNVGVVTAVFPNKGMPLPFVSRGGSNLMILMALVGVLLSVARASVANDGPGDSQPVRRRGGRAPRGNPFNPDTDEMASA